MQKGEISKNILNALLVAGGLFVILSSSIGAKRFLKRLPKELKCYRRLQLMRALRNLRAQNLVEVLSEVDGEQVVKITENGHRYFKKLNFDTLSLEKPSVWDKKWRLVIFDIPEKRKSSREALRGKLRKLGFKKLQHSIWVTPFPCEKELNLIKTIFNISDYWIDVIITQYLGTKEYVFRKHFDLI